MQTLDTCWRLPSPVCLVAHNGNVYDYLLLKAEIEKAGVQVGSDILCACSYVGIKAIFQNRTGLIGAVDSGKKQPPTKIKKLIERKSSRKYNLIQKRLIFSVQTSAQSFSWSHGVEADCLALLRTTSAWENDWLDWVELNCKLFSDCQQMWGWDWKTQRYTMICLSL